MVGYSQGAEIIDTVLCGNGDPKQSVQSTGSIAGYNIKAAIFMGDPRYETGAPYNVGTCKAGGVRKISQYPSLQYPLISNDSSPPAPPARPAATTTARSSRTATPPTRTAAMAAMLLRTMGMGRSMASRLLLSSMASFK